MASTDEVGQRLLRLNTERLTFSTEVKSLQRRLAEVRSHRQDVPASASDDGCVDVGGSDSCIGSGEGSASARLADPSDAFREMYGASGRDGEARIANGMTAAVGAGEGHGVAWSYLRSRPQQLLSPRDSGGPQSAKSDDFEQLKTENNRLTEQLVEASMQSAMNLESFSNDRNALWRFATDLRQRVQEEQAERARCSAKLASTQEALDKLAEENVRLAETLMHHTGNVELASPMRGPPISRTVDALVSMHRRESKQHRLDAEKSSMECEELRRFVERQTEQANATILELAKRNLELERQLHDALRRLAQQSLTAERCAASDTTPTAVLASTPVSGEDEVLRASASPPQMLLSGLPSAGNGGLASESPQQMLLPGLPSVGNGVALGSESCSGSTSTGRGGYTGNAYAVGSGLVPEEELSPARPRPKRALVTSAMSRSTTTTTLAAAGGGTDLSVTLSLDSSRAWTPRVGTDGRCGGRGAMSAAKGPGSQRSPSGEAAGHRSLEAMSLEVRRMQARAISAVAR